MFDKLKRRFVVSGLTLGVALLIAGVAALSMPAPASAHCDSVDGPVVGGARKALETGEVKWALMYVQPDAEAELKAAFEQTLAVRKAGGDAQKLADQYFFETTVRLHRVGEGANYTGLKTETDFGPALEAAEKALETKNPEEAHDLINKAVSDGLSAQWKKVVAAREMAAHEGTVEALREQAEAELIFQKYVDALYNAALGNVVHAEGAVNAPAADPHGK